MFKDGYCLFVSLLIIFIQESESAPASASTVCTKCRLITQYSQRPVPDKGRSWPLFEWPCLGRQGQETAAHLPVLHLVPSQMGVITSCLAPKSLVGVEVKGHDPALPEHDLGM